jgi:flagellar hook-associated protein 3 FlgL
MRLSTVWMQQAGVNAITHQQSKLSKTQLNLATGSRILTPSDDPIASSRALNLKEALRTYQQYQDNAALAINRLSLEEATLASMTEIVQRVRELAVQANNQAALRAEDKSYIAQEVRQALGELLGLGNSTNGQGEYLFAGAKAHVQPYPELTTPPGYYAYQGDDGGRLIQIGPTRRIADGDPGRRVFEELLSFRAPAEVATQGALPATYEVQTLKAPPLTPGSVFELSVGSLTLKAGPLDSDPTLNELVTAFTSDPNYATAPFTLAEGTGENAGKLVLTWTTAGEVDELAVLQKQDNLFSLVDQFARSLEGTLPEEVTQNALFALDNALERLNTVRADLGARLNAISKQQEVNEQFRLKLKETLSGVQDLDYAEAIGQFNLEQVALQAAQQAFVKVQGLSLFNFLR